MEIILLDVYNFQESQIDLARRPPEEIRHIGMTQVLSYDSSM